MRRNRDTSAVFMKEALAEARKAGRKGEVPVGCVIAAGGKTIARAGNRIRRSKDPTAHAEVLAIRKACKVLKNERIGDTILYSTVEPCAMCAGAIVLARISRVVYGAPDPKTGSCGSVFKILPSKKLNHRPSVEGGVLAEECGELLRKFFQRRRTQNMVTARNMKTNPGVGRFYVLCTMFCVMAIRG